MLSVVFPTHVVFLTTTNADNQVQEISTDTTTWSLLSISSAYLYDLDEPRKVEFGIQRQIVYVGDEGGDLFFEILEFLIIARFAHGIVVIPGPVVVVITVVVLVG